MLFHLFDCILHLLPRSAFAMATLLESEAAFTARALEHGVTREQLQRLQDQGFVNMSKLAFAKLLQRLGQPHRPHRPH